MAISVVSFSFSRVAQPEAQISAECGLSLPHLVSNSSDLQLTDFLSPPSYIIVQLPTQYLWNGMFDRHQAEITGMQFKDHSLPVHQSMTLPLNFTLSHIVKQARLRDFFPKLPSECITSAVFGIACLAGSKVNVQHIYFHSVEEFKQILFRCLLSRKMISFYLLS